MLKKVILSQSLPEGLHEAVSGNFDEFKKEIAIFHDRQLEIIKRQIEIEHKLLGLRFAEKD